MSGRPLVSAIIPAFDGERWLGEAIESVRDQTYRPVETIVVDDGSTDGTAAVVASYSSVRSLRQPRTGVAAARNAGAAIAGGEILAFLDQDDRWTPRKLELQVAPLVADPSLDYTLGRQRFELEPGAEPPAWLATVRFAGEHLGHFPGTLVVRRAAFERLGGFRPEAVPAEGADWFLRAQEHGLARHVVDELVLIKRLHERNQSGDQRLVRRQVLAALRRSLARRRQTAG